MNETEITIQKSTGYIMNENGQIKLIFMGALIFITLLIGYVVISFYYTTDTYSNVDSSGLALIMLGLLLMITSYAKLQNYR